MADYYNPHCSLYVCYDFSVCVQSTIIGITSIFTCGGYNAWVVIISHSTIVMYVLDGSASEITFFGVGN